MLDTYKSVVYYHDDKPRWAETVKVRKGVRVLKRTCSASDFLETVCRVIFVFPFVRRTRSGYLCFRLLSRSTIFTVLISGSCSNTGRPMKVRQ